MFKNKDIDKLLDDMCEDIDKINAVKSIEVEMAIDYKKLREDMVIQHRAREYERLMRERVRYGYDGSYRGHDKFFDETFTHKCRCNTNISITCLRKPTNAYDYERDMRTEYDRMFCPRCGDNIRVAGRIISVECKDMINLSKEKHEITNGDRRSYEQMYMNEWKNIEL